MNTKNIKELIDAGESRVVEFKTSRNELPGDLYESICAFLNRDGGDIILGVKNDGSVQGINPVCTEQMKKNFTNMINNPEILNPPCYLSINDISHDGQTLLHIYVPPSSQVHRCKSRIYDRNEDGDYDITDNQNLVAKLYVAKQSHYTENTIYPHASISDLIPDLIKRARKLAVSRQPGHPWASMNDRELLNSAQLWKQDYQNGTNGLTLAAILLFGKDSTILSVLPHHRTDAILRRKNTERYDDRDDIRTNLLDSHTRLLSFGEKHLDDPFYLEGSRRISLRNIILREIIGNLIIHREYSQAFPAKLVIEKDILYTENGNRPHGHGAIDPKLFSPYPKNPAIARVFKEIGLADELGSGVRNLFRYCKAYCGHNPEMIENDIFRLSLRIGKTVGKTTRKASEKTTQKMSEKSSEKIAGKTTRKASEKSSGKTSEKILLLLKAKPYMTIAELSEHAGVTTRSIERNIKKLQQNGVLERIGPDRSGRWKILGNMK